MKTARIAISVAAIIAAVFMSLPAAAENPGNIQGYGADAPLNAGTIVELTGKNANQVKTATQSDLENMFGVVVDQNQVPVKLINNTLKNQTFVTASGTYNVLVNTQNGEITSGDYVTLSSVDGVAMRAGTEVDTVLGRAQGSFDGRGATLGKMPLKDKNGKTTKEIAIGLIPVTINITSNPTKKSTKVDVPKFLQRLGQQIAEKRVDPIRIYLSMAITAISLIIALIMLYSGVRNSVVSIGRNPMSKKSIFRALLEVILTSLLVLIVGLFAVYLLLKL